MPKREYDVFFENCKVAGHMLRLIIMLAASVVFSPLHASAPAEAAEAWSPPGSEPESSSVFRSQVAKLQAQMLRYRALAVSGGWPRVPGGPTLKPGVEDPRIGLLATRLAASGDLADDRRVTSDYDETLQAAVRRFQARHALDTDGLVGRATVRALNVPLEQRIDQVRVNLERARRLSDKEEDEFILVNIAAFRAMMIQNGQVVWTTKVVVGAEEDQTPEFRSELVSVVINPTWSVPDSIAKEELLPRIKQEADFFTKGGYRLYDRDGNVVDPADVDWHRFSSSSFPFRLVQRPGPQNQLGRVKFMIPNPDSICMHDTPARSLFASMNRALSHGCIRVGDPVALAELVLRGAGWTRASIDAQIESGDTKAIVLETPLPVLLVYLTAEVDDLGAVHFYDDIYGRDAGILEALDRTGSSAHHVQPPDQK